MIPVDLRKDGLLWLINTSVLHPRGFALAINTETGDLSLVGDGSEPWQFGTLGDPDLDSLFAAVESLFERARTENAE